MRLEHLKESAPGTKGKTTAADAKAFVSDAANAEFIGELKRIAKKMGGVTTVIEVLKAMGSTRSLSESNNMIDDILNNESRIREKFSESGKTKATFATNYAKTLVAQFPNEKLTQIKNRIKDIISDIEMSR